MVNEIVYVNPSHQHSNVGVNGYGIEADQCYIIAKRIVVLLKDTGIFKEVYLGEYGLSLVDSIAEAKRLGATIVIDIHTNANVGKTRGAMVLYKTAKGKAFAQKVYDRVSAITPTGDHGLIYRDNLGILNQTAECACLVEMVFHDNAEDVQFFLNHKEEFAVAIAQGICDYCGVDLGYKGLTFNVPIESKPVTPVVDPRKEFVKKLQAECNRKGITDINGNKLVVDGIPGNHTYEALAKVILKEGSRGNFVKLLQERLGINADGIFGKITKAKVIEFQLKPVKIWADGIVGYNTWRKLIG